MYSYTKHKNGCPLQETKKLYKHDYDLCVRKTPTFKPRNLVFISRPPLTATNKSDVSSIATGIQNKLQGHSVGPFRIISVQSHTVTIDKNFITNTVCNDRVTYDPDIPASTSMSHTDHTRTQSQAISISNGPNSKSNRCVRFRNPNGDRHEYTVDRIVRP